jgi:hypothetical protein
MNQPGDDELRARFDALRAEERERAPDFRAMRERAATAQVQTPRRYPALLWLAAAAVVVLAAGLVIRGARTTQPMRLASDSSAPAVAPGSTRWTSPTAGFLITPGMDVLKAPSLHSSILDGIASASVVPKGD